MNMRSATDCDILCWTGYVRLGVVDALRWPAVAALSASKNVLPTDNQPVLQSLFLRRSILYGLLFQGAARSLVLFTTRRAGPELSNQHLHKRGTFG